MFCNHLSFFKPNFLEFKICMLRLKIESKNQAWFSFVISPSETIEKEKTTLFMKINVVWWAGTGLRAWLTRTRISFLLSTRSSTMKLYTKATLSASVLHLYDRNKISLTELFWGLHELQYANGMYRVDAL